jgi:hypothetical protein
MFSFIKYFIMVIYAELVASTSAPDTDYRPVTYFNRNQRAYGRRSATRNIIFGLLYPFRRNATCKSEEQEQV